MWIVISQCEHICVGAVDYLEEVKKLLTECNSICWSFSNAYRTLFNTLISAPVHFLFGTSDYAVLDPVPWWWQCKRHCNKWCWYT